MNKYSLNKLRLDLYKLVSGPDCKHVDQKVKAIGKNVGARYTHTRHYVLIVMALFSANKEGFLRA